MKEDMVRLKMNREAVMKYGMLFLTIVLLLAACAPSAQAIETAVAQTQAAWTPTPTSTLQPTAIPQNSIIAIFVNNGYEPCWKMGFGIDDGVFEDGVTYECYYEKEYLTTVLVGYDGSLVLTNSGYKAEHFNTGAGNIIEEIYGNDVRSWIDDSFGNIEGGKQEISVNNFQIKLYVGDTSAAIPGSWGLGVIIEITPPGENSHIAK